MNQKNKNSSQQSLMSFLDFFASPLQLWFHNRSKSYTTIGFLLTLGMICLLSAVIKSSGTQLLYREKPRVLSNLVMKGMIADTIDYHSIRQNVTSPIIKLGFLKENSIPLSSISDIQIFKLNYTLNNQVPSIVRLETLACKDKESSYLDSNYINLDYDEADTQVKLKNYLDQDSLCFADSELEMSKYIGYEIRFASCNSACLSGDVIKSLLATDNSVSLLFVNQASNTANFSNPYFYEFNEIITSFSLNLKRKLSVSFKSVEMQSDIGFIMQSYIYDYYINMLNFQDNILDWIDTSTNSETPQSYLTIELRMSDKTEIVSRYFMKAQDLAALVGGILKVYILVAGIISNFFSSNFQMLSMINFMFKYTENEASGIGKLKSKKNQSSTGLKRQFSVVNNNVNSSQIGRFSEAPLFKIQENNYFKNPNYKVREELNEIEQEKENIINKLSLVTTTKLAKNHLMVTDYKYSSFKFIMMQIFPFFRSVREEKKTYNFLSSMIRQKLDLKEVFQQMINFKRFKHYFCTREQLLLLNLDSKLTFEPDANDYISNTSRKSYN